MNNLVEVQKTIGAEQEDTIDLKKIFSQVIDKWLLFLVSIIVCLLLGFFYIKLTAPTYQINAKLLVTDNEKGGSLGQGAGAVMDFGGLFGGKNSVDNEVEILKTRFLMEQVVRKMKLNIVYNRKSNLTTREIYNPPFVFNIIKGVDTIGNIDLTIERAKNSRINVIGRGFQKEVSWNEEFKLNGVGIVKLEPNSGNSTLFDGECIVKVCSVDQRVAELMRRLSVSVSGKLSTIIYLGLTNESPQKGEDILNALIHQYITANLQDKNTIADSTTKFIQNRLSIIAGELGDVEDRVQDFKQGNKLADMSEQGKLLVQNSGEFSSELAKAETQVLILTDLENYLKDESKNTRVFPASLLPSDMVFSGLMAQYNSLLVERDKQLLSVTEESPFIKNIDQQISGLRSGILANIQSTKNTYIVTRDKLRSQLSNAESQIGGVPKIEKDYLKLARNQQIKQELYIFLMQKAEETAISKTSNIAIAKTIDPPKSEVMPITPKKNIVYLASLILGIVIPGIFIILVGIFNVSVSSKEDIVNHTSVPIIGEISHNEDSDNLVVANKGRSAISEQFRALRTNLSFYLKNENEKIILLTSSMSGEGKSFTAINLGNILALAGKKVLLMELDLRKPGLSAKVGVSNNTGFSNYIITADMSHADIIKPLSMNDKLFIISSGPLPPNPAETLMNEKTGILIEKLKHEFDYILMDAPPIGVISDAQLLSQYADVTLYLVRQKVTQKNQLSILEDLYRNKKMNNLGIIVNGIVSKYYGYGYGYGSYGENEAKKSWLSKLLGR
ncbi:polysaccharide biosynthesis tyrosine autokinase [Pedobacter sp. R20-19]|uniref:GumC family protein n=1 Tax=Pedobacter sp. R20-19 TaxID=1270196 RepID=UPI000493A8A7|nr:polysaccharide biosynthesis tyrosine autokinase [Pedobacter sp. R20-19]